MATTFHPGSPNQQSLVLECSVCTENYGPEFDSHPRSLRCGHTFCTSCLMKLLTPRGVKCPVCSKDHPLSSPDVTLLPVNYAVQQIILSSSNPTTAGEDMCANCKVKVATVVCVDCSPGENFKFCSKCDIEEHTRDFIPVQRHKRFPIDAVPPKAPTTCLRHGVSATLYSESLDEYACNACTTSSDWGTRSGSFEPYSIAVKKMRNKIQKMTKYTNDVTKRLTGAKQNLEKIISELEPGSMEVKASITKTFTKCIDVLQERQRVLLTNVDDELRNRTDSLKKQHQSVVNTNSQYRDAFQNLNGLLSKPDAEFLLSYRKITRDVEPLLDGEEQSLLRPLVNQDIPFCIANDIVKQLGLLGAVGGGLTPIEFECSPSGSPGTLMQFFWRLPERCGKLNRFEIEYEQVQEEGVGRPNGSVANMGGLVYTQKEPQLYEVPGSQLTTFLDYLCPNYSYRFRIRSSNDAGFGMWSDPIVGKCADFPFTLNYTKKIHRIIIPISGHYCITVRGAKAADGMVRKGGRGAIISGSFYLKCGDILIMLVGGMSSRHDFHSGGAGGTFVAVNDISQENLLLVAGGGGGTRGADDEDFDGGDASLDEDGNNALGTYGGKGGRAGGKGGDGIDSLNQQGPTWGNGGAGFMEDSSTAFSFKSGGNGGQNGGFGGGGGVGNYGGGGGGGYSGGGGGRGGGGGGSYVSPSASDVTKEVGNEDHGSICIEKMEPPYPSSLTALNRVPSSNDSTSSASSSQIQRLDSQASSSSLHRLNTTSSGGMGTSSISTIPEHTDTLYQSPSSTAQVMDRNDNISPVMFAIDQLNGSDDPAVELIPRDVSSTAPVQLAAHVPDLGRLEEYGQYSVNAAMLPATSVGGPQRVNEVFAMEIKNPLGGAMESQVNSPGVGGVDSSNSARVQDLIDLYQSQQISTEPAEEQAFVHRIAIDPSNPLSQGGMPMSGNPSTSSTSQWVSQQPFDQDHEDHSLFVTDLSTLPRPELSLASTQQYPPVVSQHGPRTSPPIPRTSPPITQQHHRLQHHYLPQMSLPGQRYTIVPQPNSRQNVSPPLTQVQSQHSQLKDPVRPPVPQPGRQHQVYMVPQPGNGSAPVAQVHQHQSQPILSSQPGDVQ